jgi:lysophospholipase L1-like esterase
MKHTFKILVQWFFGFVLSFFLVWIITQICSDTLYNWSYDTVLEDYVIKPGTIHRHRKEGWATTFVGEHGIYAIEDIKQQTQPKVVFWGDSFVQSFQVNDEEKLAQQFTSMWNQTEQQKILGVGIGTGERGCADYYHLIPAYREILSPIQLHVIILPDIIDLFPDYSTTRFQFVSQPEFRLYSENAKSPINNPSLMDTMKSLRVDAFFRLAYETKTKMTNLQFQPGPRIRPESESTDSTQRDIPFYHEAWTYLISEFKHQTEIPFIFVYCPPIPTLQKGEIVITDKNAFLFQEFTTICKKHDVDTIDMSQTYVDFYQQNNRFPRGFMNSHPTDGHFNRDGHRQVAQAVCQYLKENNDAIYSN